MLKPPNLFLIGAPKAGTSALADVLVNHPEIHAKKKEPRFFDARLFHDDPTQHAYKDLDAYLTLFKGAAAQSAQYRLDASVFVMYDAEVIRQILAVSPDARFIVVLRDPVSASQSMHAQRLKYADPILREVSEDFCDCWTLLKQRRNGEGFPPGCRNTVLFRYDFLYHYEWHLPAVREAIGDNPLLIVDYRDLIERPDETNATIASFLGVDRDGFRGIRKVNESFRRDSTSAGRLISKVVRQLARKSHVFRARLGLVGYRLEGLRRIASGLYRKKATPVRKTDLPCLEAMRAEFAPTMAYLDELFGVR